MSAEADESETGDISPGKFFRENEDRYFKNKHLKAPQEANLGSFMALISQFSHMRQFTCKFDLEASFLLHDASYNRISSLVQHQNVFFTSNSLEGILPADSAEGLAHSGPAFPACISLEPPRQQGNSHLKAKLKVRCSDMEVFEVLRPVLSRSTPFQSNIFSFPANQAHSEAMREVAGNDRFLFVPGARDSTTMVISETFLRSRMCPMVEAHTWVGFGFTPPNSPELGTEDIDGHGHTTRRADPLIRDLQFNLRYYMRSPRNSFFQACAGGPEYDYKVALSAGPYHKVHFGTPRSQPWGLAALMQACFAAGASPDAVRKENHRRAATMQHIALFAGEGSLERAQLFCAVLHYISAPFASPVLQNKHCQRCGVRHGNKPCSFHMARPTCGVCQTRRNHPPSHECPGFEPTVTIKPSLLETVLNTDQEVLLPSLEALFNVNAPSEREWEETNATSSGRKSQADGSRSPQAGAVAGGSRFDTLSDEDESQTDSSSEEVTRPDAASPQTQAGGLEVEEGGGNDDVEAPAQPSSTRTGRTPQLATHPTEQEAARNSLHRSPQAAPRSSRTRATGIGGPKDPVDKTPQGQAGPTSSEMRRSAEEGLGFGEALEDDRLHDDADLLQTPSDDDGGGSPNLELTGAQSRAAASSGISHIFRGTVKQRRGDSRSKRPRSHDSRTDGRTGYTPPGKKKDVREDDPFPPAEAPADKPAAATPMTHSSSQGK